MAHNVTPIKPLHIIPYHSYEIKLIYRPETNDWAYEFRHTQTLKVSGHGRTYDAALRAAQARADILGRNLPASPVHPPTNPKGDERG